MPDGVYVRTTLAWRAQEVRARVHGASEEASLAGARAILSEANKTVPYETGRLKGSGRVDLVRRDSKVTAVTSYNTPYAVRLHENPQYHFHGKGRGKWLQLAVQEMAGRLLSIMAGELSRRIRL